MFGDANLLYELLSKSFENDSALHLFNESIIVKKH